MERIITLEETYINQEKTSITIAVGGFGEPGIDIEFRIDKLIGIYLSFNDTKRLQKLLNDNFTVENERKAP